MWALGHDAAAAGRRVERGVQKAGAELAGQAPDKGEVHAADDTAMPGGEQVERAVAKPNAAVSVASGLKPMLGEHSDQLLPRSLGAPRCRNARRAGRQAAAELAAELPGGLPQAGQGNPARVRLHCPGITPAATPSP